MKNPIANPLKPFLLLAAWFLNPVPVSAGNESQAALSGIVTGPDGARIKDAKVILLGRNLTVRTDANGMYAFTDLTASFGRDARLAALSPPRMESGSLRFVVRGGGQRVRVSLFTLSGSLAREVADAGLTDGEYQVEPFTAGMAAGTYLLRVRIGDESHLLALPYWIGGVSVSPERLAKGAFRSSSALSASSASVAPVALRKTAAVSDTLSVVAVGFERGERLIAEPSGTQDFKLNALKYVNVPYKSGVLSATEKAVCILDIHSPKAGTSTGKGWPVVIHFHGGGLTGGDRNEAFTGNNPFGQKFLDAGVMEIAPGYRLIRHGGTWPDYIRDAAQAAIWVRKNIEVYGGDPNSVFISGFSAGAYLTHMLSVDSTWFSEAKFDPRHFAGFISMSGQTRVHDSLQMDLQVADIMKEKPWAVPMGNIRKTVIPWQIFTGSLEGHTVTDNQALYDACIKAGSTDLFYDIIPGLGHEVEDMGNAISPKRDKFLAFINKYKGKGI